jgi:eukaryotic-like serine/threonine-protein kinase
MPVPGSRLDRFEIRELLGAGGMGEVWRAHDARLNRDVALKLLPENFLRDPERRARFERETQVLAALNHPNIGALFEVVALPESHVLVLELVEGQTLSERIAGGLLPVPEALGIATQIAAALEAAHERGIVHRDLKAGNVQIRPDGTVKLLDFGLAKETEPRATPADPTLTAQGIPGLPSERIIGSPAYMSPEQARGLPVDRRTDIWAFGCLLYEMLCGVRAFAGERAQEVLARILERDPDFSLLPAGLPRQVEKLLRRCLEKDRRLRLRDIGDARLELLDALARPETGPAVSGSLTPGAHRVQRTALRTAGWKIAALIMLAVIMIGLALQATRKTHPQAVTRFTIAGGGSAPGAGLALSADGRLLAYATQQGLMVRALDRLDSRLVAPNNITQGGPFFSPDGQWLGFRGWESLRRVSIEGGPIETILDRVYPAGDWAGKDQVLFGDARGIFRVAAAGGTPEQLLALEGTDQVVSVEALPEREAVLYTVVPMRGNNMRMAAGSPAARIEALDLRTGQRHLVLRGGGRPRLTPTGHLLYASGNTIYAVGFDRRALTVRGTAVPVVTTPGMIEFDVSDNGTLAYQSMVTSEDKQMVWVDRQGVEESLGAPARAYLYPRISPDGTRVAIDVNQTGVARDVWIWDLRRATLERFTQDPAHHPLVAWSPDSRFLVYGNERFGASKVYRQAADGSGKEELLLDNDELQMPVSFAPDGRLLVSVGSLGPQRDLYLMNLEGERRLVPLIQGPANELWAEVSPDGRWVAYDSDESGQFEVYVRPFPGADGGSRWQVSAGGRQPLWSRDGRELFFRSFDGSLMSVPVTPGTSFEAGRARRLFGGSYLGAGSQGGGRTYDVAPDGKRFLMLKQQPPLSGTPELVVVLNWFEELGRLAPLD